MKTKFFLFGVMMVAFLLGEKAQAQVVQMATVQHGETMKAYYGVEALKDAIASAQNGDIISLSAGQFNAPVFSKGVTIQGAGHVIASGNYTAIVGDATVNVPNGEEGLVLEGLHFRGKISIEGDSLCKFAFRKCRMEELAFTAKVVDGEVSQSKVKKITYADANRFYLHHDVVQELHGTAESSQIAVDVDHCVVTWDLGPQVTAVVRNSMIRIARGSASCAFYNNVAGQNRENNWNITSPYTSGNTLFWIDSYSFEVYPNEYRNLFADPAHANNWNETFDYKLTEEAAAQYIGSDGTQVGIYGGAVPFTEVLSTPQIVEKVIATQTDENGMLSVKIKVEAQK